MISILKEDLSAYDRFKRANLINSLSGFKPVVLAGTKSSLGNSNLALISNICHIGSDPALIGYMQRPPLVVGDTYRNIMETGHWTFNFVAEPQLDAAHACSAKYPPEFSEFEACGFEEEYKNEFGAPFVKSSPIQVALQLQEILPVKSNGTFLVIGSVEQIHIDSNLLEDDGNLDLRTARLLSVLGLEKYYSPQFIAQKSYAGRIKS